MDTPFADGPPDDPVVGIATDAVRDEIGSQLCAWVDGRRVCRINIGKSCWCKDVAEAVIGTLADQSYRVIRFLPPKARPVEPIEEPT